MKSRFYILFLLTALINVVGAKAQEVNRLSLPDIKMSRGSEATLTLSMDNAEEITAVEFLLSLPDGFSINTASVALSSRKADHTVTARAMGNNTFKVMVFSQTNSIIPGIKGELLSFTLKAQSSVTDETDYQLTFADAVMANRSGDNVLDETKSGTVQIASLPNLHVISLDCSEARAGEEMNVKWKVRNDGLGNTGDVEWKDYVWLVPDIQGNALMTGVRLLATTNNKSALKSGEYYENSINVNLQKSETGNRYLVVTTDMYSVINVDFSKNNNEVPDPYEPTSSSYGYFRGYGNPSYVKVQEEGESNGWSDNFFYKAIDIPVPPMPDIQVTKVTVIVDNSHEGNSPLSMAGLASSTSFYSGKQVLITATITNKGDATTELRNFASDAYLSSAEKHEDADLVHLSTVKTTAELEPEESIDVVFSGQIPYSWSGNTWFHVYADTGHSVYELANIENNWGHSVCVDVMLTPTADFEVSNLNTPSSFSNTGSFDVSYSVENIGPGAPHSNTWTDKVYISKSPNGIDNTAICVGTFRQSGKFENSTKYVGDNYSVTRTVQTHGVATGTYYIYVVVDANNEIFEFDGENNNVMRSGAISCVAPDLTVEIVSFSDEILYAKSTVSITLKIRNIGNGAVSNAYIRNQFFVSKSANGSNATDIGSSYNTVSIASGSEKTIRCNIQIPENSSLYGDRYIFVYTNANQSLRESNYSNNSSTCVQKVIDRPQVGMNLKVSELTMSETVTPGNWVDMSYTVANTGSAAISKNVSHKVYLSQKSNGDGAVLCSVQNTPPTVEGLQPDGKITVNQKVMIPVDLYGGEKYLKVVLDEENVIEEADDKDNVETTRLFVNGNLPDLIILDDDIPDIIYTSTPTEISFKINNQGQWDAAATTCNVKLKLSAYEYFTLTSLSVPTLKVGETTSIKATIMLGDKYTGNQEIVIDPNGSRIPVLKTEDRQLHKNITSKLTSLPDLVLSDLSVNETLYAGETATVNVKVNNKGDDATHTDKWTEQFYLSMDFKLNTRNAIYLGEKAHVGKLDKNGSYDVTANVRIPTNVHGYYFLYVVTDGKNANFEKNKDNNTIRTSVNIENGSDYPADLKVQDITAPLKVMAGEPISLTYSILNNGQNVATGTLRDVIYLSKDVQWDENDIMVGVVSGRATIEPGNTIDRTVTGRITNVVEGEYHFIVKVNSTHTIPETDYNNNLAVHNTASEVAFTPFPLGGSTDVISTGYFKMPVTGDINGKTLGFYLHHDDETPVGLYVSYNQVPSTARHEYSSTSIEATEQEVLVPDVQEGTYYILAQANAAIAQNVNEFVLSDIAPTEDVPMSLSSRIVPFGASSLSIKEGGNNGWISTEIHGALLDSIMDFRLTREGEMIPAESITFYDQTSTRASFNLNDAETGSYDIVSELPNGTQATLPDGFKVVPGVSANLGVKIDAPHWTHIDSPVPVTIVYANGGNTDIVLRGLLFSSDGGDVGMTIEDLKKHEHTLSIKPKGKSDSRGFITIPPGAQETINCFFKQYETGICYLKVFVIK